MFTLLYVSGDETSSQSVVKALDKSGYQVVYAATADDAEQLLTGTSFRAVVIGTGLFCGQKKTLANLADQNSLSVILVCTAPADYTILADEYVPEVEGPAGILRAVEKAVTIESYEVTV